MIGLTSTCRRQPPSEGPYASEYPGDSGPISSVDQPKAGDSGSLSERCDMSCWRFMSKVRDADGDGQLLSHCHRIDIRQLDFVALKAAGYRGAVVDKDNCLVRLSPVHHS